MNKDEAIKVLIKTEVAFLERCCALKNEHGAYLYVSKRGADHINLAMLLYNYKEYLIENGMVKPIVKQ